MTDEFELDDRLEQLFATARSPGSAEELSLEGELVGAMARIAAEAPVVTSLDQRRRTTASKVGVRAAIVVAAVLVGTSTVAAATGNLPDAAQSAVARATSHVGIRLHDPHDDRDATTTSTSTSIGPSTSLPTTTPITQPGDMPVTLAPLPSPPMSTAPSSNATTPASATTEAEQQVTTTKAGGVGPDLDGPAKKGLCQAWASHGEGSAAAEHSTAMARLQEAATAAGQTVEQFCAPLEAAPITTDPPAPAKPDNNAGNDDQAKDEKVKDEKVNEGKPPKDTKPPKDEKEKTEQDAVVTLDDGGCVGFFVALKIGYLIPL